MPLSFAGSPSHSPESFVPLYLLLVPILAVANVPAGPCGSQADVPAALRVSNTVRWTTASEQENFGYDVFRGDAEEGPFTKLTKQPILGNGTTDETHEYTFADAQIDPCRDYWYYVEAIDTRGGHEKFTPVFHAPAKRHAPAAAGPAAH